MIDLTDDVVASPKRARVAKNSSNSFDNGDCVVVVSSSEAEGGEHARRERALTGDFEVLADTTKVRTPKRTI
jgi:hypothetical protein